MTCTLVGHQKRNRCCLMTFPCLGGDLSEVRENLGQTLENCCVSQGSHTETQLACLYSAYGEDSNNIIDNKALPRAI
jgi:hypothetical protein